MLHPRWMADIVQQGIKEGDRQVLVRVIDLESGVGGSFLVPQNPRGEERIEDRLDER